MRAKTFFREVARNLSSGTSRIGAFLAVATAGVVLAVLFDVLTIAGTVRDAIEYRGSGAAVVTLALPARVDGEACEALTGAGDVRAAGAMRHAPQATAITLPGSPLEQYVTTPTFPMVLDAVDRHDGVYASADVVAAFGERGVPLSHGTIGFRGEYSYPPDGRRAGLGWALLSPTPAADGAFDECWALVWPERPDTRQLLLTTLTPSDGTPGTDQPQVSQLNAKFGTRFAGAEGYAGRISQYATYIAFILGGLLAGVAVWTRRVEIASNLHAGARRDVLLAEHLIEVVAWSLPAAAIGWLAGVGAAVVGAPTALDSLTARSAQIAFLLVAGSLIGAAASLTAVREGRLWRYVKGR